LKLNYDKQVDAAYLSIIPTAPGLAKKTYACDPDEVGGQIQLDFDAEGRLIGIEVLDASHLLPKEVLRIK
jgi:YD repeat-containing protein